MTHTTRKYAHKISGWIDAKNEVALNASFKIEYASIKLRQPHDPEVYVRSKDWLLWKTGL